MARKFLIESVYGDLLERPTKQDFGGLPMKAILLALALGVTAAVAQSPERPMKTAGGEGSGSGGDGSCSAQRGVGRVYHQRGVEHLADAGCGG